MCNCIFSFVFFFCTKIHSPRFLILPVLSSPPLFFLFLILLPHFLSPLFSFAFFYFFLLLSYLSQLVLPFPPIWISQTHWVFNLLKNVCVMNDLYKPSQIYLTTKSMKINYTYHCWQMKPFQTHFTWNEKHWICLEEGWTSLPLSQQIESSVHGKKNKDSNRNVESKVTLVQAGNFWN